MAPFYSPEPCQLQQMALFRSGMTGKLDTCSSARSAGGLVTSGKGPGGGCLGFACSAGFIPAPLWDETLLNKASYLWVA